jgi:4-hydroxy-tetrahydrodipicolinate synthase
MKKESEDKKSLSRRSFLGTMAGAAVVSMIPGNLACKNEETRSVSAGALSSTSSHKEPFRGVFTIPSTPFLENGEVDLPGFRRIVDFCIECGAHGLVYPVNASEWSYLSDDERLQLTKIFVEQNAGRIPCIVSVTASTEENAARFASYARSLGADGLIAVPPRGESSLSVISSYYKKISDTGRLPVFIQNHDAPAGTPLSAEFVIKLCREHEYVSYIKEETTPSTFVMSSILEGGSDVCKGIFGGAGGRYLIEEYRRGCSGQMPGCHVTDVVVAFWNALETGDNTRALHIYKEMAPLFFFENQMNGCYKEVLKRRGVISCALKRNGKMPMDKIASDYLDEILKNLEPLMSWGK